jgi:hypothetical protein
MPIRRRRTAHRLGLVANVFDFVDRLGFSQGAPRVGSNRLAFRFASGYLQDELLAVAAWTWTV